MSKKVLSILILLLLPAGLLAFGSRSFGKAGPEQTAEVLLTQIAESSSAFAADDADLPAWIEQLTTRYQPYFTKEALNRAFLQRSFTIFSAAFPEFQGEITLEELNLERTAEASGDISLLGDLTTCYISREGEAFSRSWIVQIRLVKEEQTWLVTYLDISPVHS